MVTGVAATAVAAVSAEFDPTTQPTRGSFWVFLFIAVALVLLLISMMRHLRRAAENLPSTRSRFEGFPEAVPESPSTEGSADSVETEDKNGADRPR